MICEACQGKGHVHGAAFSWPCRECNGSGVASCCDAAGSSSNHLPSFVCPRCGAKSFNPNDIAARYCGRCHAFVDDPPHSPGVQKALDHFWQGLAKRRAEEAYRDDRFPERPCDRCGKPYRGPAVYCSLTCAIAHA